MTDTATNIARDDQPVRQYLNFVFWSLPAVLTITFSNLYLVPKIAMILEATGLKPDQLPGHIDAYFAVHYFLLNHLWIFVLGFVAIVIIPEWLFSSWYRFRRYFLGFIAYLINTMGLLAVTFLAIAAVTLAIKI